MYPRARLEKYEAQSCVPPTDHTSFIRGWDRRFVDFEENSAASASDIPTREHAQRRELVKPAMLLKFSAL
jgi:hypothetical protein